MFYLVNFTIVWLIYKYTNCTEGEKGLSKPIKLWESSDPGIGKPISE